MNDVDGRSLQELLSVVDDKHFVKPGEAVQGRQVLNHLSLFLPDRVCVVTTLSDETLLQLLDRGRLKVEIVKCQVLLSLLLVHHLDRIF